MGCCSFLKLFIPVLIRSTLAGRCGEITLKQQTVPEGTTVYVTLHCEQYLTVVQWHYEIPGNSSTILCDSRDKQCKEPTKYTQSTTGKVLTIGTVSLNDSGIYFCIYYIENQKNGIRSKHGKLTVTREDTRASKKQHVHRPRTHLVTATIESKTVKTKVNAQTRASTEQELQQNTVSTEITTEYHSSTTNSATAKVDSETEKTAVIVEDTCQVTTIVAAGVVALGVMLTVVAVVIICKKQTKNDIHRASQKSAGHPHSRQQSERVTSAAQHGAEYNPGALYDQQASRSATEKINAEYANVIPKTDRISSTQQRETNKGGKDKNEHGPMYANLDLVSRPRREADSKEKGATEYVSIDFQKTTKKRSQLKSCSCS